MDQPSLDGRYYGVRQNLRLWELKNNILSSESVSNETCQLINTNGCILALVFVCVCVESRAAISSHVADIVL